MPNVDKLPIFTHPYGQITFYADDPTTHKQILQIINPYDFLIQFKIPLDNVKKFTVNAQRGVIRPNHTAEIIVKHLDVSESNIGIYDKLQVLMYSGKGLPAIGTKDIKVILLDSAPRGRQPGHSSDVDMFQRLEASPDSLPQLRQHPLIQERRSNNKFIYIAAILLGVITLAIPKEGDVSLYFPDWFSRPSSEMKLMVAYLLGIISVLLLQS